MARYTIRELKTVKQAYWRIFTRGLAALFPTLLTLYIIILCYSFLSDSIATPINTELKGFFQETELGNRLSVYLLGVDPEVRASGREAVAAEVERRYQPWVGIAFAIVLVFVSGAFITSLVGRKIWAVIERRLVQLPVIRAIYPHAKQMSEFLFKKEGVNKQDFRSVVAVEYPRRQVWSIGFITSGGYQPLSEAVGTSLVTVYVPSAPTPVTGWVMFVPERDVVPLDLTVEEAFRFCISCGVVVGGKPEEGASLEALTAR